MILVILLEAVRNSGGVRAMTFISSHEGDITALLNAAAMAAAFGAVLILTQRKGPNDGVPVRKEKHLSGQKTTAVSGRNGEGHLYHDLYFSWAIRSRRDRTAAFAVGTIMLSLFLNALLSVSGAIGSDPGAEAASEQTAAVSLPLGLMIYGLLTPLCEESVFRGITLNRVYRVLLISREKSDKPASGEASERQLSGTGFFEQAHSESTPEVGDDGEADEKVDGVSGILTQRYERTIRLAAILITSALFGLYHGNLIQGFYAFCMGILFGFFVLMTGSLPAVILLHGTVNAVTLLIGGSNLYNVLCTTPAWLAALAAAGVLCLYYAARRNSLT